MERVGMRYGKNFSDHGFLRTELYEVGSLKRKYLKHQFDLQYAATRQFHDYVSLMSSHAMNDYVVVKAVLMTAFFQS